MKVSIITVCFNSASTITDTFKSIDAQTYPNIEYIVVDGGSTDGTVDLIKQYQYLVNTWVSEPDNGLYDAMNKGIQLATGDIIGILNSDDVYARPDVVSNVVKTFEQTGADCVYGDLQYVSAENPSRIVRHWKAGKGEASSFYWGWMPPHPTFFVTKSTYAACGQFDTRFPVASDYEFMLRVMLKYGHKAAYLPQVLVQMRLGGKSNKSLANRKSSFFENHESWRVNDLKPYFFTIWLKILRKLLQFRPFGG